MVNVALIPHQKSFLQQIEAMNETHNCQNRISDYGVPCLNQYIYNVTSTTKGHSISQKREWKDCKGQKINIPAA